MQKSVPLLLATIVLSSLLAACSSGNGPITPPIIDGDQPASYELLFSDRICRWDSDAFPIGVFIDQPPADAGAYGPIMQQVALDAVDTWDGAVEGIPDVFMLESDPDAAEITVRWQDTDTGGFTRITDYVYYIDIHKIALSEDLRDTESIKLIMGHELGHVLGLGHSLISWDLMFGTINPTKTSLTSRDREMVSWLYDQQVYTQIRAY